MPSDSGGRGAARPYASWRTTTGVGRGRFSTPRETSTCARGAGLPSDPRSMGPCRDRLPLPELWVEDADGRVVRVAVPSDGCGAPKSVGLDEALAALTVVDETFTPESLVESARRPMRDAPPRRAADLAGPDATSGLLADADVPDDQVIGEDALIPFELPAWPEVATVDGARLCDYVAGVGSTTSPEVTGDPNVFTGVRELATAEAQAVLADARRAPEASACRTRRRGGSSSTRVSRAGNRAVHRRTRRLPTPGGPGSPASRSVAGASRPADAGGLTAR